MCVGWLIMGGSGYGGSARACVCGDVRILLLIIIPRHTHAHTHNTTTLPTFVSSAQPAVARHGNQPSAPHPRWAPTATENAAVHASTGARVAVVVAAAAAVTVVHVALTIMLQQHQTTRAPTAKMVTVTSTPIIVQLGRIARIAATAAHLSVQVGIGTLQTVHLAAALLGVTRVQHLTSAAKAWGWQPCPTSKTSKQRQLISVGMS